MRLPVPKRLGMKIADRAVQYAREDVQNRGWTSSGALQPYFERGRVGITTSAHYEYLLKQNAGFEPFIMRYRDGQVIGMSCKQGDGPHARTWKADHAGTPGMVDIPHQGETFRPQRWRHPGLKPKRFIESSIQRAIKDTRSIVREEMMKVLKGQWRE